MSGAAGNGESVNAFTGNAYHWTFSAYQSTDHGFSTLTAPNATHSPWPFRVRASDGFVNESYTGNAFSASLVLEELLNLAAVRAGSRAVAYRRALAIARNWQEAYPEVNPGGPSFGPADQTG